MLKAYRAEWRALARPARLLCLLLAAVLAAQGGYLAWACLTQWTSHMDADASSQIVKIQEIVKAGGFSLRNWNDTTSLLLDTPLTPAALLAMVLGDVFVAHGITDLILDELLILAVGRILAEAGAPLWARLLCLVLVLTPYGEGAWLSYANCVLVQSAHYSLRLLYYLYLVWAMLRLLRGRRGPLTALCAAFVLGMSLLIGVSSGLFLPLLTTLPVLLFCLLWAMAHRRYGFLRSPAFLLPAASLAALLLGAWAQKHVIHFSGRDAAIPWVGYTDFFDNLAAVCQGYFRLLSALPFSTGVPVLSLQGVLQGCGYLTALALLGALVWALAQARHAAPAAPADRPDAPTLLRGVCVCVALTDGFICVSAALHYGETVYEARYLIFAAVSLMLLLASGLPDWPLPGDLRGAAAGVLALCAAGGLLRCDQVYARPTYDYSLAQAMTRALDEAYPDVRVVYMVSDDHDRKVLRTADPTKVYRMVSGGYNPGDYTYYTDGQGLEAGSLLLCTAAQYEAIDPALRDRFAPTPLPEYWLYFDKAGVSGSDPQPYRVYYCADGGIDLTALAE